MSEKILGLELSADRLTAVLIMKSFKTYTIADAAWTPYRLRDNTVTASIDVEGETSSTSKNYADKELLWKLDAKSFEDALTNILLQLDLKGCSTSALCLPASLVSFRTLKVPFNSDKKIRQILSYELTSHLPMNQTGYISDFLVVNGIPTGIDNLYISDENHIFTASVPVDIVDISFSALKKHGLQPELVTSQGLLSAISTDKGANFTGRKRVVSTGFEKRIDGATVFIETTQSVTVLSFMFRKNIMAVRSFSGKKDEPFIEKAIRQTISGLEHTYNLEISKVDRVVISAHTAIGGEVRLYGGRIGLSRGLSSGKLSLGVSDGVSPKLSDDFLWFNAIAAALSCFKRNRQINFCQGEYAINTFLNKFKDQLVLLSIFAAITSATLFINIQYDIFNLNREVKAIDKAITERFKQTFPDVKTVVEPLMQMQVKIKEAEAQRGFGSGEAKPSHGNIQAIEILYELSNRIPDTIDVEVTRFLLSDGRVVMAGITDNFNTVDRLKTLIEGYRRFKSVTINSATADKTGNMVSFNFIIEL